MIMAACSSSDARTDLLGAYTLKSLTGLERLLAKAARKAAAMSPSTTLSSALRVTVMEGAATG